MLNELCTNRGIYLYLANVTRTVTGTCDPQEEWDYYHHGGYITSGDDIVDMNERTGASISLDQVVSLDGKTFARDAGIPSKSIIQDEDDEPFGYEPDSGDWDEEDANHYYNATVSTHSGG